MRGCHAAAGTCVCCCFAVDAYVCKMLQSCRCVDRAEKSTTFSAPEIAVQYARCASCGCIDAQLPLEITNLPEAGRRDYKTFDLLNSLDKPMNPIHTLDLR